MNLGGYTPGRILGRGGSAVVYEGLGPRGERVAIKVLARSPDPARFERERRLLESLGEEEGFVPLLASGDSRDGPFIVMKLVEGGTLRDRLEKAGKLTPDEVTALGTDLALALGHAHERGIVHRDLKPENVLFPHRAAESARWPRPLVADLGIAKHFRKDTPGASRSVSLSGHGELRGTAGYMSPEQARDPREAGPAADVFSLGAILYECATGARVFEAETLVELLAKLLEGSFTPVRTLEPSVPAALAATIERALARDPARRFANGAELARALAGGEVGSPRSRSVGALVALGLLLASLAAVGGALVARHRSAATGEGVATETSASPPPPPVPKKNPAWFDSLAVAERPPLPLPRGVRMGESAREYVNEPDGSVLVYVPPGTSPMGTNAGAVEPASDPDLDAHPEHEVELSGYFVGRRLVTASQFAAFATATRHARAKGSRADALAYCAWAGGRLPTEAEWERLARGASALGVTDLSGPIREVLQDGYDARAYAVLLRRDPHRPIEKGSASVRGGAGPITKRDRMPADALSDTLGFRLARYAAPPAIRIAIETPSVDAPALLGEHLRVLGRVEGPVSEVTVNGVPARFEGDGRFEANVGREAVAVLVVVTGLEGERVEASAPADRQSGPPRWYVELAPGEKPSLPLRDGVVLSSRPRHYQGAADGSELVYVSSAPGFFFGKFPVTNREFAAFVAATGYRTNVERGRARTVAVGDPKTGRSVFPWIETTKTWRDLDAGLDHPVVAVTQADARAYAEWAGLRLATSDEWDRVAMTDAAGKPTWTPWGGDVEAGRANLCDLAYKKAFPWVSLALFEFWDGFDRLAPVGSFPRGVAPCGAHDLLGNVLQLCQDTAGQEVVTRGFGWDSPRIAVESVVPWRYDRAPTFAGDSTGFRVAR